MENHLRTCCSVVACLGLTAVAWAAGEHMGEYAGTLKADQTYSMPARGTVVAMAGGIYRVHLWSTPEAENQDGVDIEIFGAEEGPDVLLMGQHGGYPWNGQIKDGRLTASIGGYGLDFDLQKIERRSPTLEMAPPAGAVVLLPYKSGTPPDMSAWTNQKLKAREDGSMEMVPRQGGTKTLESFGGCKLHMEFNVPLMSEAVGQHRANSGVFLNNTYEVQILDSFGVIPGMGDCGAIYNLARPQINASLPPGQWQTYDITFRAPKMDASGKVIDLPRLTVEHNGIKIHDDVDVLYDTRNRKLPHKARGPIELQDHGNPMRFRNIWLVNLED